MTRDLGLKLRLTQQVTGCVTQKALHARFKQVNPQTGYEPDRAYKWIQGRAAPRDRSVFWDLAGVLDLAVTGETLRSCSFQEFRRLVEARHGPLPPAADASKVGRAAGPWPAIGAGEADLPAYLAGRYLVFSTAWSALQAGSLILGSLTIEKDAELGLRALYQERLAGEDLALEGPLLRLGLGFGALLRHTADEVFSFMSFRRPVAPALAMAGVMSGSAYHDADARPVACRLFCVRVATEDSIEDFGDPLAQTGYRPLTGEAVAAALSGAGVAAVDIDELSSRIIELVTAPAESGVIDTPADAVNAVSRPLYDTAG